MARDSNGDSIWATPEVQRHAALDRDLSADVCVVGAGIAGLSVAYALARAGRSVVVLDAAAIASGETSRTTAELSNAIDDYYLEIEKLHGREGARLAAESHTAAIDWIERIVRDERIECDFERLSGYLVPASAKDTKLLEAEREAAVRAGLRDVELMASTPLQGVIGPCLRFPNQAQFHPLRYLAGLARGIEARVGRIFTGTRVTGVEGGSQARVTTANGHTVSAAAVVVATNVPINDRVVIHTKQAAYRSYVSALRIPRSDGPRALFWDTADPYHFVRTMAAGDGYDLLLVGGEDHKTGQADDAATRYHRLEAWARTRFPAAGDVAYRWSGQIIETVDYLAFIGRNPTDAENVYIVTGDSGHGMTHGTIAGLLICDLILGRENAWAKLYDPARKTLRATSTFVKENANVARQYGDWLARGDVETVGSIPPGAGAVLREGLKHFAVYRDESGDISAFDAACPHLGCLVHWNSSERTFDCPCHGSRFDTAGRVINGPANRGLAPVESATLATEEAPQQKPKRRMRG